MMPDSKRELESCENGMVCGDAESKLNTNHSVYRYFGKFALKSKNDDMIQ